LIIQLGFALMTWKEKWLLHLQPPGYLTITIAGMFVDQLLNMPK